MKRYTPQELLEKYRAIFGSISQEEFFRSPRHKKTQEMWCAGHFALAFNEYISACCVWIADVDTQTDTDFVLECNEQKFPFQVTEVMEPGRLRGDEYRNDAPAGARPDDWGRGSKEGPSWVRAAIEKKALKNYAGANELNILCYLNFHAWSQEFEDIRDVCADVSSNFASVWLLNGNALCCIRPLLKEFPGWIEIPETLAGIEI